MALGNKGTNNNKFYFPTQTRMFVREGNTPPRGWSENHFKVQTFV